MRVSALSLPLAAWLALLAVEPALASTGVILPPSPQGPGGEDAIETADGSRCRQSINSNGAYLDAGAAGRASTPLKTSTPGLLIYPTDRDNEGLAYVRVTIPLGKRPERIDCSRLYEMEIARLKREVELLKLSAE